MRIFLIGMMGSGKSYCSKLLAQKLETRVYDLDFLIESNEEKTIAEMFEEDGEEFFRNKEAEILRWFDEKKDCVVATGGGTPCFNNNIEWMNENGITIWLNEPTEVLVKRLKPEKEHRPLIKDLTDEELGSFLERKLEERRPYYSQATHTIVFSAMKIKDLVKLLK
jgi:shikimate kinase